jgi:hypothetical protein
MNGLCVVAVGVKSSPKGKKKKKQKKLTAEKSFNCVWCVRKNKNEFVFKKKNPFLWVMDHGAV